MDFSGLCNDLFLMFISTFQFFLLRFGIIFVNLGPVRLHRPTLALTQGPGVETTVHGCRAHWDAIIFAWDDIILGLG